MLPRLGLRYVDDMLAIIDKESIVNTLSRLNRIINNHPKQSV